MHLFFFIQIPTNTQAFYERKFFPYFGFGVGQESYISMPKLGFVRQFPIVFNKGNSEIEIANRYSFYVAADVSMLAIVGFVVTPSVYAGVKAGPITFDLSLANSTYVYYQDKRTVQQLTYNPKLGLKLGNVWLKVGTSMLLKNEFVNKEFFKWGKHYVNLNLNFLINTKKGRYEAK